MQNIIREMQMVCDKLTVVQTQESYCMRMTVCVWLFSDYLSL